MVQYLFNRRIEVTIDNGSKTTTFFNSNAINSLEIKFDSEFSDEPTPNTTTVTIFNLSESSRKEIKKGAKIILKAGYVGDIGIISEGYINEVLPIRYDGVTKETTFNFIEGVDYSSKKDINMSFGKGSFAKTIIQRIAQKTGISVSKIELKINKKYNSGYTADGNPLNILKEIVESCQSSMYFRRGKLVIRDIKKGDDERFILEQKSGLINYPQYFEDDNGKGYTIESFLQHRIATASIIEIKSKYVKGTYRVRSGRHSGSSSSFTTNCEVIS